jgi:hypothetical protein
VEKSSVCATSCGAWFGCWQALAADQGLHQRRIAQGKSQREIRRCFKGTLGRQLYRLLERTATKGLRP